MIEVTMYDVSAEQAFDCIRSHAVAIVSLTSNPDTGEWVATVDSSRPQARFHWLRTDEGIADSIMGAVTQLGYVAGHQGQVMEPWEAHDAVCNGECLEADKEAGARDAAIRFMSMPYTARWHIIDRLGISVEVDRNCNSRQQALIWLERVREADKVAELIEALNKESRSA